MKMITKNIFTALILILTTAAAMFAQEQPNASAPTKNEDDFVTEKGFKSKLFEIKHRNPNEIVDVLRQLGSGFKGAGVTANSELKTLTVRDYPENLAIIEEAIKRLDTPVAPTPGIELHMYILVGSKSGGTPQLPAELRDVVEQLQATLTYKNYELVTSIIQRLKETNRGLRGQGTLELTQALTTDGKTSLPYLYVINEVSLREASAGKPTIQIGEFSFTTTDKDIARVQTALSLRDGEKVVVGTATVKDKSLIIVLIPKLIF